MAHTTALNLTSTRQGQWGPGWSTKQAETQKRAKYDADCARDGRPALPVVKKTFGGRGGEVAHTLRKDAREGARGRQIRMREKDLEEGRSGWVTLARNDLLFSTRVICSRTQHP